MMINKYTINFFINTFPGLISIVLSFFSIPIYLRFLGYAEYGDYLMLHIFLTIAIITNFNLGKIASIRMQKVNHFQGKKIISTTIIISFFTSLVTSVAIFFLFSFFSSLYEFSFFYENKYTYIALFLSNLYITLENLCKSKKLFLITSFTNLLFYSFSISAPCIFLILNIGGYENALELFKISFFLKILGVLILLLIIFYKKLIYIKSLSIKIINDFIIYAKWQTLSSIYVQIFDFFDKYIVKIVLGSATLSLYVIPQQIAGKLSVISDAVVSVFLPRVSSNRNKDNRYKIFNANFYGFFYIAALPLILLLPYFDEIIIWWLGKDVNFKIFHLFKIFILASFYICVTQIISTFYDTILQSKKNFRIDSIVLIFFIAGMIFSVKSGNIYYFAYTALFKSILSFLLKLKFISNYIMKLKILIMQNVILISIFLFEMNDIRHMYYLTCCFFIVFLITFAPLKILKNEFFK